VEETIMLVQVRTDNHVRNSEDLQARVRAEVERALLPQFAGRLRRVEVYLQDANSHKGGVDKRCSLEAQLSGHQPVVVHEVAASVDDVVRNGLDKLARAFEHTVGRLDDRGGRVSMSGEPT
jgi:hypothetical protein